MPGKSIPKYGYNFLRTRRSTQFDIITIAVKLRQQVARYVMNEKYVPKKWRYFDGLPAVNYARTIRDCISKANDIQIGNEKADPEKVKERLRLEERALAYCNLLQFQMLDILEDCETATESSMREIADLLEDLIKRLIKWNETDNARAGE